MGIKIRNKPKIEISDYRPLFSFRVTMVGMEIGMEWTKKLWKNKINYMYYVKKWNLLLPLTRLLFNIKMCDAIVAISIFFFYKVISMVFSQTLKTNPPRPPCRNDWQCECVRETRREDTVAFFFVSKHQAKCIEHYRKFEINYCKSRAESASVE